MSEVIESEVIGMYKWELVPDYDFPEPEFIWADKYEQTHALRIWGYGTSRYDSKPFTGQHDNPYVYGLDGYDRYRYEDSNREPPDWYHQMMVAAGDVSWYETEEADGQIIIDRLRKQDPGGVYLRANIGSEGNSVTCIIYVTSETVRHWQGVKRITKKHHEQAIHRVKSMIKEWNAWCEGDIAMVNIYRNASSSPDIEDWCEIVEGETFIGGSYREVVNYAEGVINKFQEEDVAKYQLQLAGGL